MLPIQSDRRCCPKICPKTHDGGDCLLSVFHRRQRRARLGLPKTHSFVDSMSASGGRGEKRPSAVITGASTGIGRAIAHRFAARGYDLTLAARDAEGLAEATASVQAAQQAEAEEPQVVTACPTDVTDPEACAALVEAHLARHQTLDVLVLCAGAGHHGLCTDSDLAIHRSLMEVNYFGALHCIQAALPALTAESDLAGRILAIGSLSGEVGLPLRSAYCASKHALSGYLESVDREMSMVRCKGDFAGIFCCFPSGSWCAGTDFAARSVVSHWSSPTVRFHFRTILQCRLKSLASLPLDIYCSGSQLRQH